MLTCETASRRLRQVLRPRSGARHAGQHRRGGRRHRRPVDRRAGHPAHDAHLPHRRRGAACAEQSQSSRTSTATCKIAQPQHRHGQPGRRPDRHGPQHRAVVIDDAGRHASARVHRMPTARACRWTRASRSSAASAWPSGTPTPCRSSPRSTGASSTRTSSRASSMREVVDERPASPTRGHRLAARAARRRPAPAHRHQGRGRQGRSSSTRRRGPLPAAGRCHSLGRGRPEVEAGDVLARIPTRKRQDPGHHRRSAARGRAVRGAPAEGPRDHRGDRRHGRVRQGLQEQAPRS